MASQKHPTDCDLPLTPELFNQLSLEREVYHQQLQKCIKEFDKTDDNECYILSKKFLAEWEKMTESALSSSAPGGEPQTVHTPCLMNQDLIIQHLEDFNESIINKQAQEHSQFSLVNRAVMQIFQAYKGHRIPRLAYFNGAQKRVELHPIKFQFMFFSRSWLKRIREDKQLKFPVLKSLAYKNQTVLDLLYRLVEFSKKDQRNRDKQYFNNAAARVYAGTDFEPQKYANELRVDDNMLIPPPGDQIRSGQMIGDLEIPENQQPILIVELQQERWVYSLPEIKGCGKQERCEYCRRVTALNYPCKCKQVEYCSQECRDKDWKYHIKSCSIQMEEDNKDPEYNFTQKSRKGLVGLTNLGNTCYMNSALQCMQHTKGLSQYFISKDFLLEINEENPIGSKGKLVRSYAKFIESVMTTEAEIVAPSKLKYTIGKTKQMFSGYEQHDSQQFLLFMLDTLHEDLNRVLKKPYTDAVDSNGRPDHVVARESWLNYLKRNQSIVNDLMGGQYRSQVKCPDCNNVSVTFDPFLIYSVPIPSTQSKLINIYLFYANYHKQTLKMTLSSKNNIARELRQDACAKGSIEMEYVKFFILGFNGSIREVSDDETVDKLINQKQFNENGEERQLFALEFLPEQLLNLDLKKYLVFKFLYKDSAITFKRPFPFQWQNSVKGGDLYDRICEFIIYLWSKKDFQQNKEKQAKLAVLKTKTREQGIFKIFACHGESKTVKEKIIYENRTPISQETNITTLLEDNNFNVQFQVEFEKNPTFNFNSYKTHKDTDEPYDYYSGHKTGTNEIYPLEQCLDEMKKAEKLVEGNEVWCSKCQDLKLAEKKMWMYKASKYLIIQLKRFKQIGYEKSKNYAEVKFPIDLDLQGHIIDPSLPETYFIQSEAQNSQDFIKPKYWNGFNTSKQTKYKLYGVVNHHGSLGGGHYTAYARNGDNWYLFDDSRVTEADPEKLVSSAAYLLFYERVEE